MPFIYLETLVFIWVGKESRISKQIKQMKAVKWKCLELQLCFLLIVGKCHVLTFFYALQRTLSQSSSKAFWHLMLLGMQKNKKSKEGKKAGKQMLESMLFWGKRSKKNESYFCLLKKKSYGFFSKEAWCQTYSNAVFSVQNTITFFKACSGNS